MTEPCTICDHPRHRGVCGAPTFITRTMIANNCKCGLVDSLVEKFGIDITDLKDHP